MLTKFSQYQRVGVFVDVQNMFYSAKRIKNSRLNFTKLMEKAVRGRQLIRAISYVIDSPDIDQTNFIEMLKSNGYEIKRKELRMRADGSSKGDWDMGIAIDAVTLAEKLDIVVLVSGDGDFADLVYHLKSKGVLVEAISFLQSTNEDLINAVDLHFPIEKDLLFQESARSNQKKSAQSKSTQSKSAQTKTSQTKVSQSKQKSSSQHNRQAKSVNDKPSRPRTPRK